MFPEIDGKLVGIVGIVIVLVLGYFVYLLFQDLVFLKKEINELHSHSPEIEEFEETDNNSWCSNDIDEEEELDRHLESFMNNRALETIVEETEEPKIVEVTTASEEPQELEIKKRVYKKKA